MITKADLEAALEAIWGAIEDEFSELESKLDGEPPTPRDDGGEVALEEARIAGNSAVGVYRWPITADFRIRAVVPEHIWFDFDADWPERNVYGGPVRANVWFMAKIGGQWHAGTFDWIKENTKKTLGVPDEHVDTAHALASHVKRGVLATYAPTKGDRCGLFVSSLARNGVTSVNERSNVVLFDWDY